MNERYLPAAVALTVGVYTVWAVQEQQVLFSARI